MNEINEGENVYTQATNGGVLGNSCSYSPAGKLFREFKNIIF